MHPHDEAVAISVKDGSDPAHELSPVGVIQRVGEVVWLKRLKADRAFVGLFLEQFFVLVERDAVLFLERPITASNNGHRISIVAPETLDAGDVLAVNLRRVEGQQRLPLAAYIAKF